MPPRSQIGPLQSSAGSSIKPIEAGSSRSSGVRVGDEAPGRTIIDLPQKHGAGLRIVGARHLSPHFVVRIAEARKGTEAIRIRQRHCRPVDDLRLLDVGLVVRRLGTVKTDLGMGAVAERLFAGMPAPA